MRRALGMKAFTGRSHHKLERLAATARSRLGFDDEAISGPELFDRLNDLTVETSIGPVKVETGVDDRLAGVCEALTLYTGRKFRVLLPESTYYGLVAGGRPLFTLSHETSHCMLHAEELIRLRHLPHSGLARSSHQIFEDTEWQADAHAAGFLMSAAFVRATISSSGNPSEDICKQRGVSMPAAEHRLRTVRQYF